MPNLLPALRRDLGFLRSPSEEQPGLLIHDPLGFTTEVLVIPPALIECLAWFDGAHTDLDLREELVRRSGRFDVGEVQEQLASTLSQAGFLEDSTYATMHNERLDRFARETVREAAHAGGAYPDDPDELRAVLGEWLSQADASKPGGAGLVGVAAPHVSLAGGWRSYGAAYAQLGPEHAGRTCVILATSHYGEPEKFGLTKKNFRTPLGEARTDTEIVERLAAAAPGAVVMEDYCHAFEHTVELQVVFLQHVLGPDVKIVPVLCGPFARSLYEGGSPEADPGVEKFLDALAGLDESEGSRLLWVLGVDMAHMGARYGDQDAMVVGEDAMRQVEARDRERIARISAGDAEGFWELLRPQHDDLKWCGSAPLYAFLRAARGVRGHLLDYGQWNIDEQSAVSFAGMAFSRE